MARQLFSLAFAPLLGLFIMALGNGFLSTLVPLMLSSAGVSVESIGFVTAAYYVGLCLGAVFNERLLLRIGYIRSYACFAAIVAASTLAQALWIEFYWWFILRMICGWATVGVFLVIESWLLTSGDRTQRGRILAFYMISFYAAMALGQLLLGLFSDDASSSVRPFIVVGILSSLSLLPIAMIPRSSPGLESAEPFSPWRLIRITPTGVAGSFGSGILLAAIYSLLPLYLQQGYSVDRLGTLMAIVIVGGMALQYPIGRWSDRHNRQQVLIVLSVLMTLLSIAMPFAALDFWVLSIALFFLGGGVFALYPVTLSHSADRTPPSSLVGMTQGMLLVNSLGSAVAAPLITPLMGRLSNTGLFIGIDVVLVIMVVFFIWRRTRRPAPIPVAPFSPAPAHSAVGAELTLTDEMITGAEQAEVEGEAHVENAEREIAEKHALAIEKDMAKQGTPISELPLLSSKEDEDTPGQDRN